jgi:hypothetical protein
LAALEICSNIESHISKEYTLTGPAIFSSQEFSESISKILEEKITYYEISPEKEKVMMIESVNNNSKKRGFLNGKQRVSWRFLLE